MSRPLLLALIGSLFQPSGAVLLQAADTTLKATPKTLRHAFRMAETSFDPAHRFPHRPLELLLPLPLRLVLLLQPPHQLAAFSARDRLSKGL